MPHSGMRQEMGTQVLLIIADKLDRQALTDSDAASMNGSSAPAGDA